MYNASVTDFRFFYPIEIRYGDLDPQGHVNNAVYLTYYEQARVAYIAHLGLWDGGSFLGFGIILAEARVTFKQPLLFGQKIQVGVRVSRLGNKSITMEYILKGEDGEVFSESSAVLVTFNYSSGKSIPIPQEWRRVITAFERLSPADGGGTIGE